MCARPAICRGGGVSGRGGFSLVELLVVISIAAIVLGIGFPYVGAMIRSSSEQMIANTASNAVSAARAYAVRYKPFLDDDPHTGRTAEIHGDGYSGAVAIFTPSREIRLCENDELATDRATGLRLELPTKGSGDPIRNGYKPIEDLGALQLSQRSAVLGIVRTGADTLQLLPPPFAISFNRRGQMVVRRSAGSAERSDGLVYYDANGDGVYDTAATRAGFGGAYRDYFRGSAPIIQNADSPMDGYRELPWEVLEPVIGLVIFDPQQVPQGIWVDTGSPLAANDGARYDPDRHLAYTIDTSDLHDTDLLAWAAKPGRATVMFFNRFTGADTLR